MATTGEVEVWLRDKDKDLFKHIFPDIKLEEYKISNEKRILCTPNTELEENSTFCEQISQISYNRRLYRDNILTGKLEDIGEINTGIIDKVGKNFVIGEIQGDKVFIKNSPSYPKGLKLKPFYFEEKEPFSPKIGDNGVEHLCLLGSNVYYTIIDRGFATYYSYGMPKNYKGNSNKKEERLLLYKIKNN